MFKFILKYFTEGGTDQSERPISLTPKASCHKDVYAKKRARVIAQMGDLYICHPANHVTRKNVA